MIRVVGAKSDSPPVAVIAPPGTPCQKATRSATHVCSPVRPSHSPPFVSSMASYPPSEAEVEQLLKLVQTVAAVRADIRLWLGASQFGVLIASCFFGANLVQLYIYATSGRRDPLWVVILVAWVWALDTIHTGFIWSWLFDKTVLDAADIARTLLVFDMTDSLSFSVVFSGLLGASVQVRPFIGGPGS